MVPENIHTLTTEGIGNSRGMGGGGGSMAKEIPEGRGGEWLVNFTFMSDIIVQNCNNTNLATS